jgi:UDP-3-O-[3-hydroxymyristoyl] glucosamine N-acyltransferase
VGIAGHLVIADRTTITGGSQVFHSIEEPGTRWSGHLPSQPSRFWLRNIARFNKLDELARKVRSLENQRKKN